MFGGEEVVCKTVVVVTEEIVKAAGGSFAVAAVVVVVSTGIAAVVVAVVVVVEGELWSPCTCGWLQYSTLTELLLVAIVLCVLLPSAPAKHGQLAVVDVFVSL